MRNTQHLNDLRQLDCYQALLAFNLHLLEFASAQGGRRDLRVAAGI